jgi:hypothetical protein
MRRRVVGAIWVSLVMPLRLSVESWYWSMIHSRAAFVGFFGDAGQGEELVIDERGLVFGQLHLLSAVVEFFFGRNLLFAGSIGAAGDSRFLTGPLARFGMTSGFGMTSIGVVRGASIRRLGGLVRG